MTPENPSVPGDIGREEINPFVASHEREESARRLYKVELNLMWMRRMAMVGWGGAILWEGHPFGFNFIWVSYLASLAYCLLLHARLHAQKHLVVVSWMGTISDSFLTFLMCLMLGKTSSAFIPFFYFTILATAFRFGGQKAIVILFFNALWVIALFLTEPEAGRDPKNLTFILLYLGYSYMFGSLLSAWAIANLRRALTQSEQLEKERDRTQDLLHSLINAQENERKKLAGDLHDGMGERSFSINHGLDECIRGVTDSPVRSRLESLRAELLAFTSYIRSFMNELRPTVLDELGLSEAIAEHVSLIRNVVPFTITTDLDPSLRHWRSKEDAMLFRLMQEALLNARRHSNAKSVLIGLRSHGNSVVLTIEDDGRGFDPTHTPVGHFGLLTMRERAEVSGGILSIDSKPGQGTKVSVRFENHG
jgi:two-component system NarL family sensor kinase